MTTLLLVRHGETDWNAEGRLQGYTDRPLNDYGRRQSQGLAERLAGDEIAAIYASDLVLLNGGDPRRAARSPVVLDGPPRAELGQLGGTGPERDRRDVVGEAAGEHAARVVAAVQAIADRHPGGRIVVVTHGGSLRRIQAVAYGVALPVVENCAVWAVAHEEGTFRPID